MLEATRQRNSTMIILLKEFDRKQYPHHYVKESKIVELIETKVEHIEFLRFEAMFVKRELIYIDEGDLSRWFLTAP